MTAGIDAYPSYCFFQFLHSAADSLCGIKHSAYSTFSEHYSLEDWWSAQEAWSDFIKEAVKANSNKDDVRLQSYKVYMYSTNPHEDLLSNDRSATRRSLSKIVLDLFVESI